VNVPLHLALKLPSSRA